jgi:predicted Zn-dependent protease
MLKHISVIALFAVVVLPALHCKSVNKGFNNLNFFPVSQDIELGKEVAAQIAAEPQKYPVLPQSSNPEAYAYLRAMLNKLRATGLVEYSNQFKWELNIIKDDKTLNAFCTPGGHIYVYTGLIKFLDSEDQLAGVMGHEMAHAARRHSTRQLSKIVGVQMLAEFGDYMLGGKQKDSQYREMIKQMSTTLISLKFSRDHETEADEMSVKYMCGTSYNAAGAAGFFKKLQGKGGTPPEFLSTHPSPANRVEHITAKARSCRGSDTNTAAYQKFKSSL